MPQYEFSCKKCDCVYVELASWDKTGKYPGVKCPKCSSKRKKKLMPSSIGVSFTNPVGTSKMDSFEYAAGYNMEKAKGERRAAEAASHMGNTPDIYNQIDDLNKDANWGEVK